MVGATGFEPATSCSQSKCSSQAELRSDCGDTASHTLAGAQRFLEEIAENLPYFKGNSHHGIGEAALNAIEQIHFERFADVVAGEVFESGLDCQLVMAGLP